METQAAEGAKTNILPWPKERAADALRAARSDEFMGQLLHLRDLASERPVAILVAAAVLGFSLGRLVGR